MDGQYNNIVDRAENVFQEHAKTVRAKAVLKKCLDFTEGRAGDMQLRELVEEYNGNFAVSSIANPLPRQPGPGTGGKRPAADVVESAAAPALRRTAPVQPDAAAGAKKPIKKPVSGPTPVVPPEPAAGGGAVRVTGRRVDPAATAATPVVSKS